MAAHHWPLYGSQCASSRDGIRERHGLFQVPESSSNRPGGSSGSLSVRTSSAGNSAQSCTLSWAASGWSTLSIWSTPVMRYPMVENQHSTCPCRKRPQGHVPCQGHFGGVRRRRPAGGGGVGGGWGRQKGIMGPNFRGPASGGPFAKKKTQIVGHESW